MRALWIIQITLPSVADAFGQAGTVFGGWTGAMIEQLAELPDMDLGVIMKGTAATPAKQRIGNVTYYLVPAAGRDGFDIDDRHLRWAIEDFGPDILHAEGAEFAHTRTMMRVWQGPALVSLQGILSGYEPYEYGGLTLDTLLGSGCPRLMLLAVILFLKKRFLFRPRLAAERETIAMAGALSGRTLWDRAHAYAINPHAKYFPCNRILRKAFYATGPRESFEPHSLFIGNSAGPRKGAHFALRAATLLKRDYPKLKLYFAGDSPFDHARGDWKMCVGYPYYLRHLITELDLRENVEFLGALDPTAMAGRMRLAHVYLLPSLIENSPNTLGEAMMLGVPVVSAYAGGAPDMARDEVDALFYRPNDPQMLAFQVKRLFDDPALCARLTQSAHARACTTHDPQRNRDLLIAAYRTILADRVAAA